MLSAMKRRVADMGLVFLALCVAVTGGCGGQESSDVSGTVTFKGKPLEFGSVSLFASDERAYMGEIQSDGKYLIKKVPVGPAKLTVECTDPKVREDVNKMLRDAKKPTDGKPAPRPTFDPKKLHLIPEAYNDPDKSGLRVEVKKPTTSYDIKLEEKGPAAK
jgi:hypothetical protein